MNLIILFLFNLLLSANSFAELSFLGLQESEGYKTYSFQNKNTKITIKCNKIQGQDFCENKINNTLKSENVIFENNQIKSLSAVNAESGERSSCQSAEFGKKISCSKEEICTEEMGIAKFLNQNDNKKNDNVCIAFHKSDEDEIKKFGLNAQREIVEELKIFEIIKDKCSSLNPETKQKIIDNFKIILNHDFLNFFKQECLVGAKDEKGIRLTEAQKGSSSEKLLQSVVSYLLSEDKECNSNRGALFAKGKVNFDRFICLKLNENTSFSEVSCLKNSEYRLELGESDVHITTANASRDAAKNNDEKFQGKPIMMDSPPEISKPIPVKQTLAQIDKMVQDNGGTVSPEIAEKAGKIFNDSVYEPTRSAINYIDNKIFKADEASTAKYKSSNVASSGKRYQIGGNRNPASKPTTNKSNRPASVSSATAAGVMGQGVGTAATGSSNVIKTALGEEKETPSPGKAARVDNQSTEKALPLNNESQRSVGSGQQSNNNLVANSASGSSRNALDNENPSLSPKASAEVNQLVGQIKTVESAEDLKSLLGLEENQEALRHLVKPVASGQDRSPASTADPLINKLKEYNIKLYDERTGKTIYSPKKTEYIMRLSDKGVRLLKPIGGTKK